MKSRTLLIVLLLLTLVMIFGNVILGVRPARAVAVPAYVVNLDANSAGLTDFGVEPSATDVKTFRVGAVINATSINPLANVQGWQFEIDYNATAFVPQADPNPAATPGNPSGLYPDGADNTVHFGANPNLVNSAGVTENWNALLSVGAAFQVTTLSPPGSPGSITVAYSILGAGNQVNIKGPNLLANVAFELVNKPSTIQSFQITSVLFVDNNAGTLPASAGAGAGEMIANDPPKALFAASPAPTLGPFDYSFDATTSSDSDGTIPTGGYFWDFGDGNQTLSSVPVLTHNFTRTGTYNVTLRVTDNLGATGSARDSLGGVIVNAQPSRTYSPIRIVLLNPDFTITANPKAFGYVPGTTSTSTITFSSVNGLSGNITLAAIVAPSVANGPLLSFNPVSVKLMSNGGNSSILSAAFAAVSPLSSYNVTVTATAGSIRHNVTLALIPGTIRVQPALVTGVNSGTSFTVSVAASAAGLFGWQFTLHYNPTILSTTFRSVTFGPFWQAAFGNNQGIPVIRLNQTAGTLLVAFTLLAQGNVVPSFTGNDTLASIVFTANSNGLSSLHLSGVIFVDTKGGLILVSQQKDGTFDNRFVHDVSITSLVATPTTVKIGDSVTITVGVKNTGLDPENITVSLSAGGASIGEQQVSLNPGDSTTLTFHWNVTGTNAGNVIVEAEASIATGDGTPNDNFRSTMVFIIAPMHDVAVTSILASPSATFSGQSIDIQVGITNKGSVAENVSLTVYYDSHVIATLIGISLVAPPPNCLSCQPTLLVHVTWDTSGVPPGSYTISATVFLATDQNLSNNNLTDGQVTILSPPTITLIPNSGSLGTKVLLQGSGFLLPSQPSGSVHIVVVSFDDGFLGTAFSVNGAFNFTFDVPHAEPGTHLIKVLDLSSGLKVDTNFTVLAEPQSTSLAVNADVGTVYFPGETAVIYVSTSLNGAPFRSGDLQLKMILFKPDGSNVTLNLALISTGFYKASYLVPTSSSVGTYGILAQARMAGSFAAMALRSFEVKPAWQSPGARNVMLVATAAGLVGIVAVTWGRSRLKKGRERPNPFDF